MTFEYPMLNNVYTPAVKDSLTAHLSPEAPMLFDKDDIPKAAPVKRMHVADAGQGMIEFECPHCGYKSGWITDEWTVTENRRGHPCPRCNPKSS